MDNVPLHHRLYIFHHLFLLVQIQKENNNLHIIHPIILNPDEFYEYIKQLKFSYLSFGEINDFQKLTTSEENYRNFARKDVVAAYDIKKGTILNSENLTLKRTGLQGAIKNIRELYGKKLFRTLKKDEIILKSSIY